MENKFKYKVSEPDLSSREREYLLDAFDSGWISSKGEYIKKFEESFSKFVGTKFATSCSNGTTALHLAVKALNIGKTDEVLVPNLTFASPANAVIYEGGVPVLVDIDRDYWGIDPERLEEAITKKTKAIIVVHLYGHPCDMHPIMKLVRDYDLKIIEDCAEATGALYHDKMVGSFGDISCFSFYANKIITTGEGGMALTDNEEYAERMRTLRDHGMTPERRYWHYEVGFNYRMTNLQAAIGMAQLETIDNKIEKRRWIAHRYIKYLKKGIVEQKEMPWAKNVYWLSTFLLTSCTMRKYRDSVISQMQANGIETRPTFYPLSEMPPYRSPGKFENSKRIADLGISLPSYGRLSEDDVLNISEILNKVTQDTTEI